MKSFYRGVIKDLQKKVPDEDTHLKSLTCLNPKQQKAHVFSKADAGGDQFSVLLEMVKCVLVLSHSNVDVERPL